MKYVIILAILGSFAFLISACGTRTTPKIGLANGDLRPCPSSPNCVSSTATDPAHRVGPFTLQVPPDEAWATVRKIVLNLPRTQVVIFQDGYLHAKCRSAIFEFVDDLELHLLPVQNQISIRSAARSGYFDFGVNRERVEELQIQLRSEGVIR